MSKKITILLPAYNEEASMLPLFDAMQQVAIDNPHYFWTFLLVNDGSTDLTLERMKMMHAKDARFEYLDLSRNFGKEMAMMAGFDYVTADAVIIMDSDLQHPTSSIPEMIHYWEQGYDDVFAYRITSKEQWLKRNTSKLYYKLLQKVTNIMILRDVGDFRLLDRTCIDALREMRETQRNTKGMYCWIGFHKKGIPYQQLERCQGNGKWGWLKLLNLAIDGFTSYTTTPLRLSLFCGTIVSLWAFFYMMYIFIDTIFYNDSVAGFPTVMITILFLGGIQLISLGIIGEYLGRMFNEVKRRPGYFINSYNGKRNDS
ncbi:MAG: glycosyltransferase family 2 protein [Bacteroidaceae bacterium]